MALSVGGAAKGWVYHDNTNMEINAGSSGAINMLTAGVSRLFLDSSGNLGLGVTPSAWASGKPAIQLPFNSSIWSNNDSTIQISQNAYFDGTGWKYINASSLQASNYYQYQGTHIWRTAASGTAGNAISFTQAMTLDASGNLGIGVTSPSNILELYRASGNVITVYTSGSNISLCGTNSAGYMDIRMVSNQPMVFATNNTERARITSGGGLLVGTTSTNGAVSNTARLVGGRISSFSGALTSLSNGVAYTMFTMTADYTTYLVTVSGIASNTAYSETAIVHLNNTSVSVTIIADGGSIAISNSGLDVQVTQSSGGTLNDLEWSATRLL
jgi:hypothetical protein